MRMLNYTDYRAARRFPALDGLRAIAALMVVFFHFGGPRWERMSGWSGVQIFFVLSGFLITTLALREEDRHGGISLRSFYLRRVFRILPVYLVVLAVLVGVYHAEDELRASGTLAALPYYASTVLTDFAPPGGFMQSWTIGIEQKFYLLWPLLAFAAGAIPLVRRAALTVGLMAGSLVIMAAFDQGAAVHYTTILIGCLLALLMHDRRTFRLVRPLTHPVVGVLIAAGFVAAQLTIAPAVDWFGGEPVVIAMYSVAVALLLPSLLHAGPLNWALSRRPATFVGERSYSLYLVQGLAGLVVIGTLRTHPGVAQVALTALVSLIIADVLHRWIEQPMIDLGRRLTRPARRGAVRPAPATTSPAVLAKTAHPVHTLATTELPHVAAHSVAHAARPAPAAQPVRARAAVPAGSGPLAGSGAALDSTRQAARAELNQKLRHNQRADRGQRADREHRAERNQRTDKITESRPAPSRSISRSS